MSADALFLSLHEIPDRLPQSPDHWFLRPVEDSKEEPGRVRSRDEILELAQNVLRLEPKEISKGALRHDTRLMLSRPARILKECRIWVVDGALVTYALYKEGARFVYRPEIYEDAHGFAQRMVSLNPTYARAYVIDICRTGDGLRLLETNCINAAGFFGADLEKLAAAIDALPPRA